MVKDKIPGTQAIRTLKKHAVSYTLHLYRYEEKGGTQVAAEELKVCIEASIMDLPRIYINAGRKGLLAEISPKDLIGILDPMPVNVAI